MNEISQMDEIFFQKNAGKFGLVPNLRARFEFFFLNEK